MPPKRRTASNLPHHIRGDADRLPRGIWFNPSGHGCWIYEYREEGRKKTKKIADAKASLADLHVIVDTFKKQHTQPRTFNDISLFFIRSHQFNKLAKNTQDDYRQCHAAITNQPTKNGTLGQEALTGWKRSLVVAYLDKRAADSEHRANKELSYMRRVFNFAIERELTGLNPTDNIKKISIQPRQHYAEAADYNFYLSVAEHANYWYLPFIIRLAYECRLRSAEALDLADANELPDGLLIKRRKGSRDNITLWSPLLRDLWDKAKAKRNAILTARKQPHPIDPAKRFIFISEFTGDKITASSLKTAKNRVDKLAIEQAEQLGRHFVPFTLHDIKRRAISDTTGTLADKMEASGHKSAKMMDVYNVGKAKVKPTSE